MGYLTCQVSQIHSDCLEITLFNNKYYVANVTAPSGFQITLPESVTWYHLEERFEQWYNLHLEVWKWMSFQVLEAHQMIVPGHFVHMIVEPLWDTGDLIRRSFRVKSLSKYDLTYLGLLTNIDICSKVMDFFMKRRGREVFGALYVIQCPPFKPAYGMNILPRRYALKTEKRSEWQAMVANDLEQGPLDLLLTDALRPYPLQFR